MLDTLAGFMASKFFSTAKEHRGNETVWRKFNADINYQVIQKCFSTTSV